MARRDPRDVPYVPSRPTVALQSKYLVPADVSGIVSAVSRGASALASGLGSLAGDLTEQQNKEDRFAALIGLSDFQSRVQDSITEDQRTTAPGDKTYLARQTVNFNKLKEDYLKTVPENLRDEFNYRTEQIREGTHNNVLDFNYKQMDTYERNNLDTLLNNAKIRVEADPSSQLDWEKQFNDALDASSISETEKVDIRKKGLASIKAIAFYKTLDAELKKGGGSETQEGPGAVRYAPMGRGKGTAPTTVQSEVVEWARGKGLQPHQIAALLSTIKQESGFRAGVHGDNGESWGLFQMNPAGGRRARFVQRAGPGWANNPTAQLEAWWTELHNEERASGSRFLNSTDVQGATEALLDNIRPKNWGEQGRMGWEWRNRLKGASEYLRAMEGGKLPIVEGAPSKYLDDPRFEGIPFEQRQKIYDEVLKEASVAARSRIEQAAPDALTSYERTGATSTTEPTQEEYRLAYGIREGDERYDEYAAARETAKTVHSFQRMSDDEIKASLAATEKALPPGEGAQQAQKNYEARVAAAAQIAKAREKPAEYVMQVFPEVSQAWKDVNPSDPTTARTAIALTLDKQRQLGIPDEKLEPLPQIAVDASATAIKNEGKPNEVRTDTLTQTVLMTPDPAQQQAVFRSLVKAGVPASSEAAVEAAARGDHDAARRLFAAAVTPADKFPLVGTKGTGGTLAARQANIANEINRRLFAPGDPDGIGYVYYGLANGAPENFARATQDAALMESLARIYISRGNLSDERAVELATKDLFGPSTVRVTQSLSTGVTLDAAMDEKDVTPALIKGLEAATPKARAAVEQQALSLLLTLSSVGQMKEGSRALTEQILKDHVEEIMAHGAFRQYGYGEQFGFFDTISGQFVKGFDGKPLVFPYEELNKAGMATSTVDTPISGLVVPGNIDLNARPVVHNADASISTERSISFEEDGKEVLIPTVAADGSRILSNSEAIAQYRQTGKHLGKFSSIDAANAYAQSLHERQGRIYEGR